MHFEDNGMNYLVGRKIVLGVTSGVAAYKAAELTRLWARKGRTCVVLSGEWGEVRFGGHLPGLVRQHGVGDLWILACRTTWRTSI